MKKEDIFEETVKFIAILAVGCALGFALYIMVDSFQYIFNNIVSIEITRK